MKKDELLYFVNCVNHVWDAMENKGERARVSKVRGNKGRLEIKRKKLKKKLLQKMFWIHFAWFVQTAVVPITSILYMQWHHPTYRYVTHVMLLLKWHCYPIS